MNELSELRESVLDRFLQVIELTERDAPVPLHQAARAARQRLLDNRYRVVVCGEFKRGKSTLLNALVNRPELFPVDVRIATSVVIELSYSAEERVIVRFGSDPDRPEQTPPALFVRLDQVADYATEQRNPHNEKNVVRIEIGLPFPELQHGLVLVDTPGIGSLNPAHGVVTRAEILFADALIFVTSAQEGLSTNELAFLADAIEVCPTVITAVTFIDMVVDAGRVITETARKIADLVSRPAEELIVVGVSAPRRHDATDNEDEELLVESGFPRLEEELWDRLADTCGRARIGAALDAWMELVETLRQPLADQVATLRSETSDEIRAQLDKIKEELRALDATLSTEPGELANDFDRAARPVHQRMADDFDELADTFRDTLNQPSLPENPARLAKETISRTVDITERASRELEAAGTRVALTYALGSGYAPSTGEEGTVGGPRGAADDLTIRNLTEQSGFVKFRTRYSGMMVGGGAGAAAGAIAGSFIPVVGTLVGAAIGTLVGQISGWFAGKGEVERQQELQERRDTVSQLRDYVLPRLDSARRAAERGVTAQQRDLAVRLEKARRAHRQTQRDLLMRQGDSLATSLRDTEEQRSARITGLEVLLELYARLLEQHDTLRQRLIDLGDGVAAG